MEGNCQRDIGNNQTESSNGEGSSRQVTSNVTGNRHIGQLTQNFNQQTFYNNGVPSTSSPSDIVIDYCPTPVPTFICREEELEELKELFQNHQVIVITGMGKSQLARKFASDNRNSYQYQYWLESETIKKLENSFNDLAKELRVDVRNMNVRVSYVYKTLEQISTLLIFDNVEKPADVYDYLPTRVEMTRANVHVLITSRCTVWTNDTVKCYPLNPLDEQAVQQLFKKNFGEAYKKVDESQWQILAKTLGHLPLALQVAASYIIERHIVNTDLRAIVTNYIDQLAKGTERLLTNPLVEYNNRSIYSSMLLTLELIEEKQDDEAKQAVRLMNMACYMNPDRMFKEDLLRLIDGDDKENMLDGALVILTKFSLMNKVNTKSGIYYYTMHRIIQMCIRHSQEDTDDYYTMSLDFAMNKGTSHPDYVMRYADERASCVYRYYNTHQSPILLHFLVHSESSVALRTILESMDKAHIKSIIDENKLLLESVKFSNIKMMEQLLGYGADVNQQDGQGNTALHISCEQESTDLIQWLLDHGADLHATNNYGWTAAHCTAIYKQLEILTFLIKYHSGHTPPHSILDSIRYLDDISSIDFLNIFFKYGVDVRQMAETGQTIIHITAKCALSKLTADMLQYNPCLIKSVDNEGRTPLHVIGEISHKLDEDGIVSTIKVLIENDLSLNTKDNQGCTPLDTINPKWKYILQRMTDI